MTYITIKLIKNTGNLREENAVHNDYSFNSKGNSLQFKFNWGLQNNNDDILDDQNLHESTIEALNIIAP